MRLLSEWFEIASEGRFKIEWVVADRWTTVPGVSTDYSITKARMVNNTPGGIKLFQAAMSAADSHFDFSEIQTVNFILPIEQNIAAEGENGFPWDQHVREVLTQEGRISSFTIAGKFQNSPGRDLWSYWMHEFGHAIGLPHVGSNGPEVSPFNPWDIMGGQDGPSKELSGWVRFVARWMSDERVYCKPASNVDQVELTLVPLSGSSPGLKLAIFPISTTRAILVESRRVTNFSCTTPTPRNGVMVYVLDLTLGHGQDFIVPVDLATRRAEERGTCGGVPNSTSSSTDPLLRRGDKVSVGGLNIEVLELGNYDKILVSR
jgi:M6 family metalloprotease-like protein